MKRVITILISIHFLSLAAFSQTGSVGIGTTTPHSSAALDVQSTDKGMLVPRMTTAQRTAISNAATGLLVFDNTTGTFWFYNGNAWTELAGGGSSQWTPSGNNIYNSNTGNVGIGVANPFHRLSVNSGIGLYNAEGAYGSIQNTDVSHTALYGNLTINAKSGSLLNQSNPQDIILQYVTGQGTSSGRVGIGTNNPVQKLDVQGNINVSGKITRTNTGTANLLPFSYGVIAANGTVKSGTGDFIAVKQSTGHYTLYFYGLTNTSHTVLISQHGSASAGFRSFVPVITNNTIDIYSYLLDFTSEFELGGVTFPAIFRGSKIDDCDFSFIVFSN